MATDPNEECISGSDTEPPETTADARRPGFDDILEPVESEEALVHSENGGRHRRASGDENCPGKAIDRNSRIELLPVLILGVQPGSEPNLRVVRKRVDGKERVVGGAEALGEGRPQAAPHRIPHHERSDQHGHRYGRGGGDQHVLAAVMPEAAPGEVGCPEGGGHGQQPVDRVT